jgi:hypothetical protein
MGLLEVAERVAPAPCHLIHCSYGPKGEFIIHSTIIRAFSDDDDEVSYALCSTICSFIIKNEKLFGPYNADSELLELKDFISVILTPFCRNAAHRVRGLEITYLKSFRIVVHRQAGWTKAGWHIYCMAGTLPRETAHPVRPGIVEGLCAVLLRRDGTFSSGTNVPCPAAAVAAIIIASAVFRAFGELKHSSPRHFQHALLFGLAGGTSNVSGPPRIYPCYTLTTPRMLSPLSCAVSGYVTFVTSGAKSCKACRTQGVKKNGRFCAIYSDFNLLKEPRPTCINPKK